MKKVDKNVSTESKVGQERTWSLRLLAYWYEIRHSVTWTWVLPFIVIVLSLFLSRSTSSTGNTAASSQRSTSSEITAPAHKPIRTATTPDYASNLRSDLELYVPLITIFMVVPPLAREWQHGTITLLALRKPFFIVLVERLSIVLIYLLLIICSAAIGGLFITVQPPDQGAIGLWLWDIIRTVGPATFFCATFSILIAVATASVITGYLIVVCFWSINVLLLQVSLQNKGPAGDFLLYTLNGWRVHDQVAHPDQWWIGKGIWLILGVICLLITFVSVRSEARLIRNFAD